MPRRKRLPSTLYYVLGHRNRIARCGASPDLCRITQAVADGLSVVPEAGVTPDDLVGFVCRNSFVLSDLVRQGYRSVAPHGAHPEDGYPDRVGVVTRSMSLAEVERAIHQQPEEHSVLFDAEDGRQVARFGPEGTVAAGFSARSATYLDHHVIEVGRASRRLVLTHNHPTGSCFSAPDFRVAFEADLHEIRAVGPDGWGYVMERGKCWPLPEEAEKVLAAAVERAHVLTEREVEYEHECMDSLDESYPIDEIWREKYAEVCMDRGFWRQRGFHQAPEIRHERLVPSLG